MESSTSPTFIKPWLPKSEPKKYLLTDCKIIDVAEGKISSNCSILLSNEHIAEIATDGKEITASSDTITVDLQGKFVCPGLIDSHVHISAVPGGTNLAQIMAMAERESMLRMTFICRDMLSRGFTTVRDCGGAPYVLKQACEEWLVPGPRLFISGHALSQTGGHGDFRSPHDHAECASGFVSGLGRLCDGVPECLRVARDEMRCGADFIKIMASGGVASPTDRLDSNQFTPEEIRAIVSVAENAHTYVTAHAYSAESIRIAIENGVKGIEHGNLLDRPTAKLMAEKGAFLTQTLVTYQALTDPSVPQFMSAESAAKNQKVLAMGLEALKLAKEEGVTLCYGSDLLGPLGYYQTKGISICAQVLTPLEILHTLTINAAKMLRQDKLGQVKQGFAADLLILNENPLDNITSLEDHENNLIAVIKQGRVCWSKNSQMPGILNGFLEL